MVSLTKCWIFESMALSLTNFTQSWLKVYTVMQIEKPLINCFRVSRVSWKFHVSGIYNFAVNSLWNLIFFLKNNQLFSSFCCLFLFINKILQLNNFKNRTAMNEKLKCSLFVLKQWYISDYIICITVPWTWVSQYKYSSKYTPKYDEMDTISYHTF